MLLELRGHNLGQSCPGSHGPSARPPWGCQPGRVTFARHGTAPSEVGVILSTHTRLCCFSGRTALRELSPHLWVSLGTRLRSGLASVVQKSRRSLPVLTGTLYPALPRAGAPKKITSDPSRGRDPSWAVLELLVPEAGGKAALELGTIPLFRRMKG